MKTEQKKLFDPKKSLHSIDINSQDSNSLKNILSRMILIRKTEQKLALEKKNGLIGGPVHLAVGQEAIAVGISENLIKTDRVFGNHRSHSHLLAQNPDFYKLFAEVLGKKTGFSRGMGGSMHLFDQSNGFYGSTPIVAGTVSLAVGAAMASKMQNLKDIGVSYIGDGAVEEGVVHECFNLANIYKLPVLFVIENNLFASHMHISLRQPVETTSRFAESNHIPYELVDGNDVVEVLKSSKKLINDIRNGKGPGFIELVTYRWYGHVDWREDIDVGVERSLDDIENWKVKDPISNLSKSLIEANEWSLNQEEDLNTKLDEEIQVAWEKAMNDPYPSNEALNKYLYS